MGKKKEKIPKFLASPSLYIIAVIKEKDADIINYMKLPYTCHGGAVSAVRLCESLRPCVN